MDFFRFYSGIITGNLFRSSAIFSPDISPAISFRIFPRFFQEFLNILKRSFKNFIKDSSNVFFFQWFIKRFLRKILQTFFQVFTPKIPLEFLLKLFFFAEIFSKMFAAVPGWFSEILLEVPPGDCPQTFKFFWRPLRNPFRDSSKSLLQKSL